MKSVEIVVPCYNEELCVKPLYDEVCKVLGPLEEYKTTLCFVDDGSSDGTLKEIKNLEEREIAIKYVSFSRNFGKEAAIFAGLSNTKSDIVVLMDADLQHPPELIPKMLEELEQGYDCCGARRVDRKGEPFLRSLFSRGFYSLMKKATGLHMVQGGSDFRAMSKKK